MYERGKGAEFVTFQILEETTPGGVVMVLGGKSFTANNDAFGSWAVTAPEAG